MFSLHISNIELLLHGRVYILLHSTKMLYHSTQVGGLFVTLLFGLQVHLVFWSSKSCSTYAYVVVVNLVSRPPQFLGPASSAPEGQGGQTGANYVRD